MKFFLCLILLIASSLSYAQDLKGKLIRLDSKSELIKEGELFKGKLQLWPYNQYYFSSLKEIEGITLGSCVRIIKINKISFSKNNSEILEIYALFSLINFRSVKSLLLDYKNRKISISIGNLVFGKTNGRTKEPIIISQKEIMKESNLYTFIFLFLIILIIVFIAYVFCRISKKEKARLLEIEHRQKFINSIRESKSRDEYEKIYRDKDNWKKYIAQSKIFIEYVNKMNSIQFKKDWNDKDTELAGTLTKNLESYLWEEQK